MSALLNRFKKNDFYKNAFTLSSGSIIAQLIPLIITPFLTRIYTPDQFGVLSAFLSIVSICAVVVTARYEMAVMLPKSDKDAVNILGVSWIFTLIFAIILFLIVVFFNTSITNAFGEEKLGYWLYFVPLVIAFLGVYQSLNYWFSRNKQFKVIAQSNVAKSAFQAGSKLGFGLLSFTSMGLISASLIGQFAGSFRMVYRFIVKDRQMLKEISKSKMLVNIKKYKKFPLFDLPSALFSSMATNMASLLLIGFFSSTIVGYYSLSYTLLALPIAFIGGAIGQVYFQKANEIKENKKELGDFSLSLFVRLAALIVIPMASVAAFGDYIFEFVLGDKWTIAGEYAMLMSLWLSFIFFSNLFSFIANVHQKQHISLYFNIVFFTAQLIILIVGGSIINNAFYTIALMGGVGAILRIIFTFKLLKMAYVNTLKIILYTLLFLAIFASIVLIRIFSIGF